MIRKLATDLGMDENPARLVGFIARQTGQNTDPNQLTKQQASIVIEGLKKLHADNTAPEK